MTTHLAIVHRPNHRFPLPLGLALLVSFALAVPASAGATGAAAAKTPGKTVTDPHPLERLLVARKYAEGLEWLRSFGKGTPEERRYRGLFHHGLAQPDPTLEHLLPVYRANAKDDTVALAAAEACLWKKDYKTATTLLANLQSPDGPEALRVRGLLLEQAGRLPEALALYERAIPQLQLPWGTLERKAQVLSWLKRFDEAAAAYQKVVASKAASLGLRQRCRVRLAELTAWKADLDGALAQLDKLLAEAPNLTDALLLKGQIQEWQGKYADAKQTYSRILALDANHAGARLRLGKLLWVK